MQTIQCDRCKSHLPVVFNGQRYDIQSNPRIIPLYSVLYGCSLYISSDCPERDEHCRDRINKWLDNKMDKIDLLTRREVDVQTPNRL